MGRLFRFSSFLSGHAAAASVSGAEKSGEKPAGEPALSVVRFFCAVYGGDGEGSIALWEQGVVVKITNPLNEELHLTMMAWRLDDLSLAAEKKMQKTIPAGQEQEFSATKDLKAPDLKKIRTMGEQQITVEVTLLRDAGSLQLIARARLMPENC